MATFGVNWTDLSGKIPYQAGGDSDVLIIVSEDASGPDVVQRRAAIELTEGWRGKLENQGIPREDQTDDLTIAKARYNLDKLYTITGVMRSTSVERLTRERVLKQIKILMKNNIDKAGVVLHYIGAGRKGTGDWCFEDGFITFRDLAHLYLQLLRGHVLWIVSDCSHSGSWVKEWIAFMSEQGVGPCGHSANEKVILISPYASCLSHQVPRKQAFSVCSNINDATGLWIIITEDHVSLDSKIADAQHGRGIESTEVKCGRNFIVEKCLCLPGATLQAWSAEQRLCVVQHEDRDRKGWYVVLVEDDDKTMMEMLQSRTLNVERDSKILASGWGEKVPEEILQSVLKKYQVYQGSGTAIHKGISAVNESPDGSGKNSPLLGKRRSHSTLTGVATQTKSDHSIATTSRKSGRMSRQPERLAYDQPGTPMNN